MCYKKPLIGLLLVLMLIASVMHSGSSAPVQAQSDQALQVPGLLAPVTVIYDQMGIPHIYAENGHDLFMAQGYVHATERWWQMEWWRHQSAGRLSEIAGESTTGVDRFFRTLNFAQAAEKDWEILSDETKTMLEAYTEGVNAYLAFVEPSEAAIEYEYLAQVGLEVVLEPWTVNDSLRWIKVMSLGLAGDFQMEVFRAEVTKAVGRLGALAFFPSYPFDRHPAIMEPGGFDYTEMEMSFLPNLTDVTPEQVAALTNTNLDIIGGVDLRDPYVSPFGYGAGIGSNSWVISGTLTDHGYPMVVNDPHLGIQMPSIWYEVGLHCVEVNADCPYNVVGVSFAGLPGIIIGHNERVAWGFTNVGTDIQDLYILTINPDNPDQYMLDGEWVDFEIVTETIQVNGGEDVTLTVRNSVWGPVLSAFLPGQDVLALRWASLDANRSVEALRLLLVAHDWESFRLAASHFDSPAQNMVYADVEGNIGYQMPGLTPIRARGHKGNLPIDGSVSTNAWQGYVPFEELPSLYNPEIGYIVTANNSVVPQDYPYFIVERWDYGYRAARIEYLIQNDEDGVFTVEDMRRIQGDNFDSRTINLFPALQALTVEDATVAKAMQWLFTWDGQAHKDSPQAALFQMFWVELLKATLSDELGFIPGGGDNEILLIENFLRTNEHPLWNDQSTPDVTETRDQILLKAFTTAWQRMNDEYGTDPEAWAWGDLHQAVFRAAPLGQGVDPALDTMLQETFNVVRPASGGSDIVNATGYDAAEGFALTSVPSMRQILIPGNWDASLRINTLGQSGRPDSTHYSDQVDMWVNIEYHPDWFSREAVEADAEATWTLLPAE